MEEKYMKLALKEAKKAFFHNEIPIGAVIVKNGKIVSKAYNKKNMKKNCLFHAEIIAITKASKKLRNWRLNDCEIYVTLEPCPMCASAIKQSRIKKVYYGIQNKDQNNYEIIKKIFETDDINGVVSMKSGVCSEECQFLLTNFFKNKRKMSLTDTK